MHTNFILFFLVEAIYILHRIQNINFLKFQQSNKPFSLKVSSKKVYFNVTLIINNFFIEIKQKNIIQTI